MQVVTLRKIERRVTCLRSSDRKGVEGEKARGRGTAGRSGGPQQLTGCRAELGLQGAGDCNKRARDTGCWDAGEGAGAVRGLCNVIIAQQVRIPYGRLALKTRFKSGFKFKQAVQSDH